MQRTSQPGDDARTVAPPGSSLSPHLRPWALGLALALLGAALLPSGTVHADCCGGGSPVSIGDLMPLPDTLLFTARDGRHGDELWRTDGTPEGTALLKDIRPGRKGSGPTGGYGSAVILDDSIYFIARDGKHGLELWRSDGTAAGTTIVKDIKPGPHGSVPGPITAVGEVVYFSADDGKHGEALWRSDGTAAGTTLVKDFVPGRQGWYPSALTAVGDTLYLTGYANGAYEGRAEIWRSDGTAVGTRLVTQLPSRVGLDGSPPVTIGDTLYFTADATSDDESSSWSELWRSDGTAVGTRLVARLPEGVSELAVIGDRVYFVSGWEEPSLWQSDGTEEGTISVTDPWHSDGDGPGPMSSVHDRLYFRAQEHPWTFGLWRSDGTADGTSVVHEFAEDLWMNGYPIISTTDGTLYLILDDGGSRIELWRSDGTPLGTTQVNAFKGAFGGDGAHAVGDKVFFALHRKRQSELWSSDGTEHGTIRLAALPRKGT